MIFKLWNLIPTPVRIWVALAGVLVILGVLGFTIYKIQDWGYDRCERKYAQASSKATEESKKGSDNVRKKEQSLDVTRINSSLCDLGIVRGNAGCK